MVRELLYLGDTSLSTAACYLAGILTHAGWDFDYLPSDRPLTEELLQERRALYLISDYPAARISPALQRRLLEHVDAGSGLLMIGGWESFQGSGGGWSGTTLAECLPVELASQDDRQNCDSPVFAVCQGMHAVVDGLPWSERPPLIGGYNRVTLKSHGQLLLTAERFAAVRDAAGFRLTPQANDPLLVVGQHGTGRVAALMTDLAPHWVGPLVDWGDERILAQAEAAEPIEVGNWYALFVQQLVAWTAEALE